MGVRPAPIHDQRNVARTMASMQLLSVKAAALAMQADAVGMRCWTQSAATRPCSSRPLPASLDMITS